jgi:hypothetical protein
VSILWVRARCDCEECGRPFTVEMDAGMPAGRDVAEAVEDALRGGELAEGAGSCSFYDDVQRCGECTDTYIAAYIAANPDRIAGVEAVGQDWVRVETYAGRVYRLPLMALTGVADPMDMRVCPFRGVRP